MSDDLLSIWRKRSLLRIHIYLAFMMSGVTFNTARPEIFGTEVKMTVRSSVHLRMISRADVVANFTRSPERSILLRRKVTSDTKNLVLKLGVMLPMYQTLEKKGREAGGFEVVGPYILIYLPFPGRGLVRWPIG